MSASSCGAVNSSTKDIKDIFPEGYIEQAILNISTERFVDGGEIYPVGK
jgi:hypothetical protein